MGPRAPGLGTEAAFRVPGPGLPLDRCCPQRPGGGAGGEQAGGTGEAAVPSSVPRMCPGPCVSGDHASSRGDVHTADVLRGLALTMPMSSWGQPCEVRCAAEDTEEHRLAPHRIRGLGGLRWGSGMSPQPAQWQRTIRNHEAILPLKPFPVTALMGLRGRWARGTRRQGSGS